MAQVSPAETRFPQLCSYLLDLEIPLYLTKVRE
jgi:hypothetical protein